MNSGMREVGPVEKMLDSERDCTGEMLDWTRGDERTPRGKKVRITVVISSLAVQKNFLGSTISALHS